MRILQHFYCVFLSFSTETQKNTLELHSLTIHLQIVLLERPVEANEIAKLAQLARINIEADMVDEVAESIGSILNLVDQLQAVDTRGVEPMSHPMDAVQRLRADVVSEKNQRDELQAIAPATDKGLFLVPKVID